MYLLLYFLMDHAQSRIKLVHFLVGQISVTRYLLFLLETEVFRQTCSLIKRTNIAEHPHLALINGIFFTMYLNQGLLLEAKISRGKKLKKRRIKLYFATVLPLFGHKRR